MLLSEYDIQYVTQKAIKGSVLSEFLAHQILDDYQPMRFYFPDEYVMALRDYEIPDPEEGPEPGSRWKLYLVSHPCSRPWNQGNHNLSSR